MPLQITLPQQHIATEGRVVGIDLGTTNSLVAYVENGKAQVIQNDQGGIVPSVVTLDDDGNVVAVGKKAKEHALKDASHTVYSVKRLMAKSFQDVSKEAVFLSYRLNPGEGLVRVQVGNRQYTPIELSAYILKELKQRAEDFFNEPVTRAVVTVPAYFNEAQRHATKDAGRLAGLDVLRIINEPTAAALAYGLDQSKQGIVAVYDLGGGTFDISILKITNGIFEVLSTNGDTYLGGDDVDRRLMELFLAQLRRLQPQYEPTPEDLHKIRLTAELAKIELSSKPSTLISIDLPRSNINYRRNLTRAELDTIVHGIVDRTRKPCEEAIADAGIDVDDIDEIVLVGGATRMPAVRELVRQIFGKKPHDEIDPDETVALGAAIQANILAGDNKDILLLDVTPLSLGIETVGGMMSVIIPRNTTIPTRATETYTTFVDNQTGVEVNVYQGERDFIRDNRKLAEFTLKGIPPMPAGGAKVEVNFLIDADGILHVTAKEFATGIVQEVEVKPSYGLTDEEIERMLRESIEFAHTDIGERKITEAKTEGERLLTATEKVLGQLRRGQINVAAAKLQELNVGAIIDALYGLRRTLKEENADAIQSDIVALEKATEPLAQEIMNASLASALEGKSVAQI